MPCPTDKVYGSLVGSVFADAIGSCYEGMPLRELRHKFRHKFAAFDYGLVRETLNYTDDGEMTLAVAEHLAEFPTIVSRELMRRFVQTYQSWRGYGRGTRVLVEAFRDDAEYEFMAEHLFPGGSLGNGAAMRAAPVGLRFLGDSDRIWEEAKQSAWPTHRHELGIEGAQLIALATSFAASESKISPAKLSQFLLPYCSTVVFQHRLARLANVHSAEDVEQFGNGIEAHESVVTALACFALTPDDYRHAIATAIWQGGDTDTIAAMTGALVGAHLGSACVGGLPVDRLEEGPEFLTYLRGIADRLAARSD